MMVDFMVEGGLLSCCGKEHLVHYDVSVDLLALINANLLFK